MSETSNIEMTKILLDIQKQIGNLSEETGRQTGQLVGLDKKATDTNGKIADALLRISHIEVRLSDYEEVREGMKDVMTTKKAIIMLVSVIGLIGSGIWFLVKYSFDHYIDDKITAYNPSSQNYK